MSVQVPPGMGPGSLLNVQSPNGMVQVSVPPGVGPGMSFSIQVSGVGEYSSLQGKLDRLVRRYEEHKKCKGPSMVEKYLPKIPKIGPQLLKLYNLYEYLRKTTLFMTFNAFLKYLALFTMGMSLLELQSPVAFEANAPVYKATSQPFANKPASNTMLNLLGDASQNTVLENTYYIYAFNNGKSAVRVCTDLTKAKFEEETKMSDVYKKWDYMSPATIDEFQKAGCVNSTILAYNGGCTDDVEIPFSTVNFQMNSNNNAIPAYKGRCGSPGDTDKLFSPPENEGVGWLWHYMIAEREPVSFTPTIAQNVTCNTTTCDTAKCNNQDCFNSAESCVGYYRTTVCGPNAQNVTSGRKSCDYEVGGEKQFGNTGYCDCGNGRKIWTCNDLVYTFTCKEKCKCTTSQTATCPANQEKCSCTNTDVKYGDVPPEWMEKNPQWENPMCKKAYGRFNLEPCEGKTVLAYAMQVNWIVNLFIGGTVLRIIFQVMCFYWSIVEDEPGYRILFAEQSLAMLYFLYNRNTYGNKICVAATELEYFQGFPWFIKLVENMFVVVAVTGVAYGADPFPGLGRGKVTLLLLWITALKEIKNLLATLYDSYSKKAYYVVGDRGVRWPCTHPACVKSDIPWCFTKTEEAYLEEEKAKLEKAARKKEEATTPKNVDIEMK